MNVYGELTRAQLEQLNGLSGTPGLRGRIYTNIASPTAAKFMFCDGTFEKEVLLGQSSALIEQNSGKAVTVNWQAGLNQKVTITDNCVISFSNPQAGQVHSLVIQQAPIPFTPANGLAYVYKLNMSDQESRRFAYQPIGALSTGKTTELKWFYKAIVSPGYSAQVPYSSMNPTTLPATLATGIDIHPSGLYAVMGRTTSPFTSLYNLFEGPLGGSYSAFGNSPVTPAAIAAQANGVAYGPDGKLLFISSATTPFIQAWYADRGAAFGTALTNPVTIPTGAGQCIAVSPNGLFVAVGHTTTPFMSVYPTDNAVWGVKLTNPVALPAAQVNSVAFSPLGDYIAAASQTTPFIQVWSFTGNQFSAGTINAVVANPSVLPTGGPAGGLGKGIAWRPQGDYIAMANTTSPFIYVVPFDRVAGTFGVPLTAATPPSALTTCVQWSPDGNFLIVGGGTSGFLYVYDFSAGTLTAPLVVAGVAPTGQVNDIAIHPSGDYFLLALNATPFTIGYAMPTKDRNYLKLVE